MSLDVYLNTEDPVKPKEGSGIFVRENGSTKEISREEWEKAFPGQESVVFLDEGEEFCTEVYCDNITHNLNEMATESGLYDCCWQPNENGFTKAEQIIEPLKKGIQELKSNPEKYKEMNPSNGWGSYEGLLEFAQNYLEACQEHPDSIVTAWR